MNSCYDWIAFISMAFSAEGLTFPSPVRFEIGEALILPSSVGVWSITITPDFLFCELSMNEGTAIFNLDLTNPTGCQILRSIDLLISREPMSPTPNPNRNALIAKIHIAKNRLNISDGDYRAMIANLTEGKISCRDCNPAELGTIMDALVGFGFKSPKPKVKLSPKANPVPTQADKIRAMWIDLHVKGIVRNRGDDALQQFVKRLTKVDRVEWLDHPQAVAVITALTKMGEQQPAQLPTPNSQLPMSVSLEFEIICEIVGADLAKEIQDRVGGCKIYIPKTRKLDRNAQIVQDYAYGGGLSVSELVRKYKLSDPWIREILVQIPKKNP